MLDVVVVYPTTKAREPLLTATQRKNLIALCKLLGCRAAGARAATVEETFAWSRFANQPSRL